MRRSRIFVRFSFSDDRDGHLTGRGDFGIIGTMKTNALMMIAAAALAGSAFAEPFATADFTQRTGKLNKWLHCSSWAPRSYPRGLVKDDDLLKPLRLTAFRTHDAPLVNSGQRIIDTQYMFPLMHLDAKDPKNYLFEPTDHWLELGRNMGMKVFYRMGTSIEHTGDWGFNTLNPPDHAKYAEVLAGIVRHYTRGWANGKKWDILYWELFNEPDVPPCWRGTEEEFIDLFVTCLKRLKGEFPELKVGGPAMGWYDEPYFRKLFEACKAAGVKPDFASWHSYSQDLPKLIEQPAKMRKLCDEYGFTDTELVLNEWHYLISWDGIQAASSPDMVVRAQEGVTGIKNIDSAVFTVSALARFQDTCLDQSDYFGSGFNGIWGYVDNYRRFAKVYSAMKMNGDLVNDFSEKVKCAYDASGNKTAFGAWSADGKTACLIVADYRGTDQILEVAVKGLDGAKRVTATVLDNDRDCLDCPVEFRNSKVRLTKAERRSAAFMVTFEL